MSERCTKHEDCGMDAGHEYDCCAAISLKWRDETLSRLEESEKARANLVQACAAYEESRAEARAERDSYASRLAAAKKFLASFPCEHDPKLEDAMSELWKLINGEVVEKVVFKCGAAVEMGGWTVGNCCRPRNHTGNCATSVETE